MSTETIKEVVEFLRNNPGYMKCGDARIAFRIGCTEEEAYEAKKIVRNFQNSVSIDIEEDTRMPKILIVDIETSPLKAYVWRLWKQDIYLDQIISEWFCLSWSAKWLYADTTMSAVLTPEEVKKEDDGRIIKQLWTLLDEADIVVAHNGNSFDIPKMKSRFILNDLPPTSPYKQIDTKVIAAKEFGFSSNKLDALARYFGFQCKLDTDFKLWAACMDGDVEALKYMETYNKYDVELLEKVYLKLRPYAKGHPNLDIYFDDKNVHCPHCGGIRLTLEVNKKFYTQSVEYNTYRCQDCGSVSRAKSGNKFFNKKAISVIPR